jgi:RHS repeat-associated protein
MQYDPAGQLTNILEVTASGEPIVWIKQGWDAAGRLKWEFTAPLPHDYTLPQRFMTYDADNRLATFNGQAVSHDLDGNMLWGPGTNDAFMRYTFDVRNRLIGTSNAIQQIGYCYDPSGNRIALTNNGQVNRFVVNPNARLSQVLIRIRGGITNYYVYGLGLVYEVTETATNSYARYYHYDYRGSTVALTDDSGNVTDRFEYSAYGTLISRTGNTDTPFLYNGRFGVQTDPNGLLYMRVRYYNPYICRFINPDPIGFSGGLNWYAFADGNPVNYLDPFGLCADSGGFFSWLGQAAMGFVEGAWDTVSGLASAVWHIDQTAAGLWNAVTHPLQTLDAFSLALAEYADVALGGDPNAIGRGVFELAAMAVPASKLRYVDTVGDVSRAARATQLARELGAAGERMSGITGPKVRIPSVTGTATYRVPDQYVAEVLLREAKNVAELRITPQLIDYGEFCRQNNLRFILDVRENTVIGPRAQQFLEMYNVELNRVYPGR